MTKSKFDKPASVMWSAAGPGGLPMSAVVREFQTLREAVNYVRTLPHGGAVSRQELRAD